MTAVSPDEAYTATFANLRVEVYDADGLKLFESEPIKGIVTLLEWAPESNALYYEVMREDGTIDRFRVDPAAGTQTEY